jgi:hypothetical protein
MEAPKKDRSMSKKDRMKLKHKLRQRKACDVDEEDNKVIELVLKGINILLLKSSGDSSELQAIITQQTDLLFKLSHHKVFRIQL